MKDERKTEIKVGVTVIVGILIFLWILGWAKNFTITESPKNILVRFDNVSGLEVGDPITINGVRKGFVDGMTVENDHVLVKMTLDSDVDLRNDAVFSVVMLDLMGGKKINIYPGKSSQPIDYNKIYYGKFYADIPEVMAMVGSVQEDIVTSLKELRVTLTQVNTFLTDEKMNTQIKQSISNLNDISQKMIVMMDENRASIKKITANSAQLTDDAREFINKNKEGIQNSVGDLQRLLEKADTLITKTTQFTNEIKDKQNNMGKILYDEQMYNNLTHSIKRLSDITDILLKQLKKEGIKVDAHIRIF
jgi:phospholipid/cholesterol/gamma-HCH transport system substrate-binding protein